MILTAYLDESGTHGGNGTQQHPGSPTLVMAGMMGTAAQWGRFELAFAKLQKRYGFKILHMVDFKKGRKEFSGWGQEKKSAFVLDMMNIIGADKIMEGVTFRLNKQEYDTDYIADRPKGIHLDSAYGLCFRTCVLHLLLEAERRLGQHKRWDDVRLHIVLEAGHHNRGDVERIFNIIKAESAKVENYTLETLTFSPKPLCIPLMVGDLLAHTVWSMDRVQRETDRPFLNLFGTGMRGKSNITHITYRPGGLANVRELLVAARAKRRRVPSSGSPAQGSVAG